MSDWPQHPPSDPNLGAAGMPPTTPGYPPPGGGGYPPGGGYAPPKTNGRDVIHSTSDGKHAAKRCCIGDYGSAASVAPMRN